MTENGKNITPEANQIIGPSPAFKLIPGGSLYDEHKPRYVCEWERLDRPTRTMTEAQSRDWYKHHQVAGDCRFALREGATSPLDIRAVYQRLLDDLENRAEKTSDRALVAALRQCWGRWINGRPYTLPVFVGTVRKARAPRTVACCPHCGKSIVANSRTA